METYAVELTEKQEYALFKALLDETCKWKVTAIEILELLDDVLDHLQATVPEGPENSLLASVAWMYSLLSDSNPAEIVDDR